MRRRTFLAGVSALALITSYSRRAHATTVSLNYAVNYAGDFTSIQTAFNSIGSDFTALSTGLTTGGGSTTTAIQLSASEPVASFTATAASGSTAITTSSGTGIVQGQLITAIGIPANTVIVSGSGSAWTISQPTTAALSSTPAYSGTDYTGHPISIGGTSCLITSYSLATRIATVSARAGYPAAFGTAPASGASYTISDVSVQLSIGNSASSSNLWTLSTSARMPFCKQDATHQLTLQGMTAWSRKYKLGYNISGDVAQPVAIYTIAAAGDELLSFYCGTHNVVINDLQIYSNVPNIGAIGYAPGTTVRVNRCWVQANAPYYGSVITANGAGPGGHITVVNSILCSGNEMLNDNAVAYGCGFVGWNTATGSPAALALSGGATAIDSWFVGCNTIGGTVTSCASDLSGSGLTVITPSAQIVSVNGASFGFSLDLRTFSGSALIGAGASNANLVTDIYGSTRAATPAIGPDEFGVAIPATANIVWSVAYNGDIPIICPTGTISTMTWAAGILTVTTVSPHGLSTGNIVQMATQDTSYRTWGGAITGQSSGWGAAMCANATITGPSTFTYPMATNPGTITTDGLQVWIAYALQTAIGGTNGGPADLTYGQAGATCPSAAADSAHIVLDPSVPATCVGHPIQWKGGVTCLITSYDTITNIATVAAMAGYPANFSGVPQAGDSYTISPINVRFNIGESSAGTTLWAFDTFNPGVQAIPLYAISTPTQTVALAGTASYDPTAALGTITNSGSAVGLCLGYGGTNVSDHTGPIGVGVGYSTYSNLQIWDAGLNQQTGCIAALNPSAGDGQLIGPVSFTNCVLRGDGATNDEQHSPILGQEFAGVDWQFTNCVMVSKDYRAAIQLNSGNVSLLHCTVFNTANQIYTTVGDTPSGSVSINLTSTANLVSYATNNTDGSFVACQNVGSAIPLGAIINTISGNTITLCYRYNGAAIATTADIPAGSTILFGVFAGAEGQNCAAENSAFFGMQIPYQPAYPYSATTCATDSNPLGHAGFSIVPYPQQLRLASGVFGGKVDGRPLPGNQLQGGTYLSSVPTDIYGNVRRNPPTIGAVENGAESPLINLVI